MLNNLTKLLSQSKSSIALNKSVEYNFIQKHKFYQNYKLSVYLLLKYFFAAYYCLISKPFWTITPKKIIIHLCIYKPYIKIKKNNNRRRRRFSFYNYNRLTTKKFKNKFIKAIPRKKLRALISILSEILKTDVELDIVELRYPYHDSHILAQLVGFNTKKYNFFRLVKKLFQKTRIFKRYNETDRRNIVLQKSVPAKLTGIKIKIAGRLTTQRVVPKKTVKSAYKGGLVKSKQSFVDSSSYTAKNKLGAYTVTVWLSHNIIN